MNLKQLPVHAMQLMSWLKRMVLDGNEELEIPQDNTEMIRQLSNKEVSIQNSGLNTRRLKTLRELHSLAKLDISVIV